MKKTCLKCGSVMDEKSFYRSHNLEKFPDGRVNMCKKCWTMRVDNWDPDTFLPLLEEADVPYIPRLWKNLLSKEQAKGKKITSMTIIGKYLSQMQLNNYSPLRFKDTERLLREAEEEIEKLNPEFREEAQTILDNSRDLGQRPANYRTEEEIMQENIRKREEREKAKAEAKAKEKAEKEKEKENAAVASPPQQSVAPEIPNFFTSQDQEILDQIDEKEKRYLDLNWRDYRPTQQIWLEKLYQEMLASYDIQTAGHKDTLKLACKASLKTHELLDMGDMDGASKASKMYDTLMKSGNFTAAQNKADKGEGINSIAEFIYLCEEEGGFIPTFYQGQPNDCVDQTLEDTKRYLYNLVTKEQSLGELIENAIAEMKKESERELDEDFVDEFELDEQEIIDDVGLETSDDDIIKFKDFVEEERGQDNGIV